MRSNQDYEAMAAQLDAEVGATFPDVEDSKMQQIVSTDGAVFPALDSVTGVDTVSVEIDPHRNAPKPDPKCLYGLVGDVARAGSQDTEANPYAIAAAFMSYLCVAVGRGAYMPVGDDWHHVRLFGLHVGRSGRGRKGTATKLVKRIQKAVAEIDEYLAPQVHDGGLSSREGLALMIHDGWTQGKVEVPPINDKRLWVLESEFANVMHQTAREGNTLSAALRDCWDGGSIKPATKTNRIWATHTHIGMTGNVTPSELLGLLKSRELSNGFANRFLIYWAEQDVVNPFPRYTPHNTVQALAQRVVEVLRFVKAERHVERDWLRVELSQEARQLYATLYRGELRNFSFGGTVNGLLERRAPMLLRIAMLFALTDREPVIATRHIEAALAWVRYWLDSVRFIFQTAEEEATTAKTTQAAQRIVEYLGEVGQATRTDITRVCFKGHASKGVIDGALVELLTALPPAIEVTEVPRAKGNPGNGTKFYKAAAYSAKSANCEKKQGAAQKSDACEVCELSEAESRPDSTRPPEFAQFAATENAAQTLTNTESSHSSHSSHGKTEDAEVF